MVMAVVVMMDPFTRRWKAFSSDELGCDSDWLRAVNLEVRTRAKKVLVAQTVGLHVAPVLVAQTLESVCAVVATICARASLLHTLRAGMHRVCSTDLVCFPDVNFCAATSILSSSCIGVGLTWLP